MQQPIYICNAFTDGPFSGNPAAVCPLKAWLPDKLLQKVAAQNNLSETAFYVQNEHGISLRWFTPAREVELCGHATLAAARVFFDTSGTSENSVIFQTQSGPLQVLRHGDELSLDLPILHPVECSAPALLSQALGVEIRHCFSAMDYLVVLETEEMVAHLEPDLRFLTEIDLRGLIVTARGVRADFVSRFFAPKYGINEDPVTGSAHCMLAPYWAKVLGRASLIGRQLSARSGVIHCKVNGERVLLSGGSAVYLSGIIDLGNIEH